MKIADKVWKFCEDHDEEILYGVCAVTILAYGAYLGYCFGVAKGYSKGFVDGVGSMESLVALMEPEAYNRMINTTESFLKVVK